VGNTPTSWTPGQTQTYTVTLTNTGNQTWPAGSNLVRLGVHFANSGAGYSTNSPWVTDQRFNLTSDLAPNASATLTVSVTAPNTANLVLEYQMVKEGQFWFTHFADVNVIVQ
jgi:Ig-like domain from next to BRCA1 gene